MAQNRHGLQGVLRQKMRGSTPGDTLEIKDFDYYINGIPSDGGGDRRLARAVYAPDSVSRDSLRDSGLSGKIP